MNIEELREYCLSIKGASESFPFDEQNLVFKVMGKMFALTDISPKDGVFFVVLKCDSEYALDLRSEYEAIEPAFHFNKKYWNSILLSGDVPKSLIQDLIKHSVDEVLKKLSKKLQAEYNESE